MNPSQRQRGGTFLGLILGLVIGLGVALGVALYVSKVPTPFSNKNQSRSAEQDAVENQKNKDWNPNNVLQPKAAASAPIAAPTSDTPPPLPSAPVPTPAAANDAPQTDPKPAPSADPLGDLAKSKAGAAEAGAFQYVIQVGAFRTQAEAEAQKAKMAMMGFEAKISEREQAGRSVYRVRLGPWSDKSAAERVGEVLGNASIEHTIVRTQR